MRTNKSWMLGLLMVGGLSLAATAPVAMRVEVEPLRQVGASTEVAVIVQVSPEDRVRIGSNAILRIELDGGAVSSGSPMRAVRLEDDGSTRVVVAWPPGTHHLRVEIEDSRKEDTGLWVGTVRIPDLSPDASIEEVPEPEPEPASASAPASETEPAPEPEPASQTASETEPAPEPVPVPELEIPVPATTPPTDAEEAIDAAVAAGAASTVVEPRAPEPASAPAPEPEIPEPATLPPGDSEDAIAAPAAAAASSTLLESPTPEPSAEPAPAAEDPEPAVLAESEPEEPPIEEIAPTVVPPEQDEVVPESEEQVQATENEPEPEVEAEQQPSLVEPLRADSPHQTTAPEAAAPGQPAEPAPAAVPMSAGSAARYAEWGSADPNSREFSMIVTRGREPATGIDISDIRLRVGGSEVPVERLGGADNAPLLLGLAIDVPADEVGDWSGMQGSLSPIVERAGGGRGRLFVADTSGVGAWDEPSESPRESGSREPMNISQLVIASLERFEDSRGRRFLVVLTDGRSEPSREEWQLVGESAGEAGVPILVIALWDDGFSNRTRKNLKKLTEDSGGSLFLVQGRAQLESAADRFGRYLDGGYSLRFRLPAGDLQTVTAISVSVSDRELEVSAPKSIR